MDLSGPGIDVKLKERKKELWGLFGSIFKEKSLRIWVSDLR
jgi:hypothetical protein